MMKTSQMLWYSWNLTLLWMSYLMPHFLILRFIEKAVNILSGLSIMEKHWIWRDAEAKNCARLTSGMSTFHRNLSSTRQNWKTFALKKSTSRPCNILCQQFPIILQRSIFQIFSTQQILDLMKLCFSKS